MTGFTNPSVPASTLSFLGRDSASALDRLGTLLNGPCVSIIGSRASTAYGMHVAANFAHDFARAGVTLITDGGHGVSSSAIRASLAAGGSVIVVQSGGLANLFPTSNIEVFQSVADGDGLVLSTYDENVLSNRTRARERSQLVAALAGVTVIVEAAPRSMANLVAAELHDAGRPVYAVPGPVTAIHSEGPNTMLRDGIARAALSTRDVDLAPGNFALIDRAR